MVDREKLAKLFKYFETLFQSDFNEANAAVINLKAEDVLSFESVDWLIRYDFNPGYNFGAYQNSQIENLLKAADYLQMEISLFERLYEQVYNRPPRKILSMFHTLYRLQKQHKFSWGPASLFYGNLQTAEKEFVKLDSEHIRAIFGCSGPQLDHLVLAIRIWINHDYDNRKRFFAEFIPLMKGNYDCTDVSIMKVLTQII